MLRSSMTAESRVAAQAAPRERTVKLIVARDQQVLYDYFRWGFAAAPNVQVILDRRLWTRRDRGQEPEAAAEATAGQRSGSDRRTQPGMRGELRARGFVITR